MDILKMLADLRAERQQIEEAIVVVERLAAGTRGKPRGRPPKWMSKGNTEAPSVDRQRLIKRLGKVDATTMNRVDDAIKISLGLVSL